MGNSVDLFEELKRSLESVAMPLEFWLWREDGEEWEFDRRHRFATREEAIADMASAREDWAGDYEKCFVAKAVPLTADEVAGVINYQQVAKAISENIEDAGFEEWPLYPGGRDTVDLSDRICGEDIAPGIKAVIAAELKERPVYRMMNEESV